MQAAVIPAVVPLEQVQQLIRKAYTAGYQTALDRMGDWCRDGSSLREDLEGYCDDAS